VYIYRRYHKIKTGVPFFGAPSPVLMSADCHWISTQDQNG